MSQQYVSRAMFLPAVVGGTLQITTASLPNATVGTAYSQAISVTGGSGSGYSVYIAQAVPNSLRWIQMTAATTLGGMPQAVESPSVTLVACDGAGNVSAPVTLSFAVTATGSLAFVTGATLAGSTNGGPFAEQIICSGGVPPYIHASPNQLQPWTINWDGFLLGAPTSTGSESIIDVVTDSAGNTVSQTLTSTIGSGIGLAGYDYNTTQINLPVATSGQNYIYNFWAFGGIGSGYSCSVTSGTITPGLSLSSLQITGAPTRAGSFFFTVTVTDGTHNQAYAICHQVLQADTATRPGYNTGTGFFVANGKLYDPSGKRFTMRGLDRNHYDSASWASNTNGALTGANTVRVDIVDGNTGVFMVNQCNAQYLPAAVGGSSGNYVFPIISLFAAGGTNTSGNTTTTLLCSALNEWLGVWGGTGLNNVDGQVGYNIANEWGFGYTSNATAWLNAYQYQASSITAISGATVTVSSAAGSNPFANSPFALIKGAGGITDVVLNVSSTGGSSGAWTVTFTASPTGTYTSGGTLYGGAVGAMRGIGYLGPLIIDMGWSGQDHVGLVNNSQAVQNSDPQQNCIFSYHAYSSAINVEAVISSATQANPCVLTLNSSLPYHPMLASYTLFNNNNLGGGTMTYNVSGATGMTALNGSLTAPNNSLGGSSGAWTITTSLNAGALPAYTGGGRITIASQGTQPASTDYRIVAGQLAALRSNNVCAAVLEFGPGNGFGSPSVAFNGYIDNGTPGVAGTVLHVTSMLTAGSLLPNSVAPSSSINLRLTSNPANSAAITSGTLVNSQSTGTTGGVGTYVVSISQLAGTAGSPIPMFMQNFNGTSSTWYGPATGASPSNTSLGQMTSALEANLVPWCYWALDDHNIGAGQACSWIGWFGMENAGATWAVPSDLTSNGMDRVFNPCYGLRTLAQPASSYA